MESALNTISKLLLVYRKENSLTQKELAENLSYISADFEGLNTVASNSNQVYHFNNPAPIVSKSYSGKGQIFR